MEARAQVRPEHEIDQHVLLVAILVLGADPLDLALRDAGLGLGDLDLRDDAHFELGLGLLAQRARGLEALVRHAQRLFGGDQLPVGVLDLLDVVHHRAAELVLARSVQQPAGLHPRPGLIPDQVAQHRLRDVDRPARVVAGREDLGDRVDVVARPPLNWLENRVLVIGRIPRSPPNPSVERLMFVVTPVIAKLLGVLESL